MTLFKDFSPTYYPKGSMTQDFGENPELYQKAVGLKAHNGKDFVAPWGTPLFPFKAGKVVEVKNSETGYGKHIRMLTDEVNGVCEEWIYGHMSKITCELGDYIDTNTSLGLMGNCFDKETEILTNKGWKFFKDLNKTETVATLHPETQEVEYHKPYSYTKKKEKEMWYFRNYHSLDMAVTGNHSMYVELQDGKMHSKAFEDLPKFSWVKQSGGVWNGIEQEVYTVPSWVHRLNQFKSITKDEVVIEMDLWLNFLGWFITDGSISNESSVRITQSFNNQIKRTKIESVLDQMPFNVKRHKEDYIINSKQLVKCLRATCPDKDIPSYIFGLSARQIRIFLDSFWLGDGWQHKSTKYYITPKKESANDLQELIMKCGGYAVIKERNPLSINRTKPAMIGNQEVISSNLYYVVTEGKHRMGMIKKDMAEKRLYNDYAYCISVENHIIYVRRNGRPMWCHNTGFVVSGATPYWKHNPYAGTHVHVGKRLVKMFKKAHKTWTISYATGEKGTVLDYENGFKGSIDYTLDEGKDIRQKQLTVISLANQVIVLYRQLINILSLKE